MQKVAGVENPFSVDQVELRSVPLANGSGLVLRARLWNMGSAPVHAIRINAIASRGGSVSVIAPMAVEISAPGTFQYIRVALPTDEPVALDSIKFEAASLVSEEQHEFQQAKSARESVDRERSERAAESAKKAKADADAVVRRGTVLFDNENMMVSGIPNQLGITQLQASNKRDGSGAGVELRARITNKAKGPVYGLSVNATLTTTAQRAFTVPIWIEALGAYAEIRADFPTPAGTEEIESIQFEAISFVTHEAKLAADAAKAAQEAKAEAEEEAKAEAARMREDERTRRAIAKLEAQRAAQIAKLRAFCRALRSEIGGKTVGALTVDQSDQRDKCKQLGLW